MKDADAIHGYANRIFAAAAVGANTVMKLGTVEMPRETWMAVVFEFTYFYIAIAAAPFMEKKKAKDWERVTSRLSGLLVPAMVDFAYEPKGPEGNQALKKNFSDEVEARLEEYRECERIMPRDDDGGRKKFGLHKFCDRVGTLVGKRDDIECEMTCRAHIVDSIDVLDLDVAVAFC